MSDTSQLQVRITGFGGQGVVLSGHILGRACAIHDDRHATMIQSFGPEARGSACSATLVISDQDVLFPYIKRPDILVVDEATAGLDDTTQRKVLTNLLTEFRGRTLIWLVHRASLGKQFDRILVMESGKVVEQGSFDELDRPGTVFHEMALAI